MGLRINTNVAALNAGRSLKRSTSALNQILVSAGTSVLAQVNVVPQTALTLLR